jgi:hypothetical protein
MSGRRFDALLLVLFTLGLGATYFLLKAVFMRPPPAASTEETVATAVQVSERPAPVRAPAPEVEVAPNAPPRSNELSRPPPEWFDAGLKPVAMREPHGGPIDRRENPGPQAKQEMELVRYAFETMDEDIRACLEQWEAMEPGQAGQVMIGFEIDANGLQRSWLDHDGGVPFGPRTCLANAVYGIDWSHIVDHPAMLTNRFDLGRDGGD